MLAKCGRASLPLSVAPVRAPAGCSVWIRAPSPVPISWPGVLRVPPFYCNALNRCALVCVIRSGAARIRSGSAPPAELRLTFSRRFVRSSFPARQMSPHQIAPCNQSQEDLQLSACRPRAFCARSFVVHRPFTVCKACAPSEKHCTKCTVFGTQKL